LTEKLYSVRYNGGHYVEFHIYTFFMGSQIKSDIHTKHFPTLEISSFQRYMTAVPYESNTLNVKSGLCLCVDIVPLRR